MKHEFTRPVCKTPEDLFYRYIHFRFGPHLEEKITRYNFMQDPMSGSLSVELEAGGHAYVSPVWEGELETVTIEYDQNDDGCPVSLGTFKFPLNDWEMDVDMDTQRFLECLIIHLKKKGHKLKQVKPKRN